jgi:hypothetical protein
MSRRLDEALVTIAFFQTEFEAGLARGALEAIGIRALVPTERGGRRRSPLGAELQVFESDRHRAAVELRRLQMRVVSRETDGE